MSANAPTYLELAVSRWAAVRAENEVDKQYITQDQREKWEEFESKTTTKLKEIIENFDGNELSDSDKDWIRDLDETINKASRVSQEDLIKAKEEREAAEAKRLADEKLAAEAEKRRLKELETTKGSLLGKLGL